MEAVENLDALPRRPEHIGVWIAGEKIYGGNVVSTIADKQIDPPRGVRIVDHRTYLTQRAKHGSQINLAAIFPAHRSLLSKRDGHLAARLCLGSRTPFGAGFRHELFRGGFRRVHGVGVYLFDQWGASLTEFFLRSLVYLDQ